MNNNLYSENIPKENEFLDSISITNRDFRFPYDHVHHADIISLLEISRNNFLAQNGESFEKWYQQGIAMVISSISIQYLREVREGAYRVRVVLSNVTKKLCGFSQEIINVKNKIVVKAHIEVAFMSLTERRGVKVPEEFLLL